MGTGKHAPRAARASATLPRGTATSTPAVAPLFAWMGPRPSLLAKTTLTIAATLVPLLLQVALLPQAGRSTPFALATLGVAVAACLAGLAPSLAVAGLSALSAHFTSAPAATAIGLFLVGAGTIAVLCTLLRQAALGAHASAVRWHEQAALLGLSREAIYVWRRQGAIESWSRGATELYGYTQAEALGRSAADLLNTVPSQPWPQIDLALHKRGTWEGELQHRTSDGRRLLVAARLQLFRGHDGIERVMESSRDITAHKRDDDALRADDRRKTELLATLAHELRDPLAPVRNSLYILERTGPEGAQGRRAKQVIERQVAQLAHLADDILEVTPTTSGRVALQRSRLDLSALVARTIEDRRALFTASGITLEGPAAAPELWVCGDDTRLVQLFGQLLQNAAELTPPGGRVTVSARPSGGRYAVVEIADEGAAIAPEVLGRLFQPESEESRTRERAKRGLGHNLAAVRTLLELHGGMVSVTGAGESNAATFRVALPLAPEVDANTTRTLAGRAAHARRRVLVVEDNRDAADTLRDALELGAHTVAVAYAGEEALERARTFNPDVVLCDIGLPRMDGYEVARAMRADPQLREAALIALTGYAAPEDVARSKAAGFDRHLVKPPSIRALEMVLAEVGSPH